MCGITAICSDGSRTARETRIRRMNDTLVHRGPDDEGYYHDEHASLGHRRLSIVDLEGGHQPLYDDSGDLVLVANGEIYNSPELREALEAEGYRFKTHSDCEVILPLYKKYGPDCVSRLRGMFAFAIWDSRDQSLFFARDHIGQKPVFYCCRDGNLYLASEVKALLAGTDIQPEIDLSCLWHYISLRFVPDDLTFFKHLHKLRAGHWGRWKNGELRVEKYWNLEYQPKHPGNLRELESQLNDLLLDTVRSHLLSDVPVGAFLSGGIDSSTIAAMMSELGHHPLPVFSIGVREAGFNELPWARKVVEQYDMIGHEQVVSADLIHLIPKMIRHMDEPSDPFGVGVYLVSEMASRHVKVVLTGDGGDENFAGYDRFMGQRWAEYYAMLPHWLRKRVLEKLVNAIPDNYAYKSVAQKALWLHRMSFHRSGDRYVQSLKFLRFPYADKMALFTEPVINSIEERNSPEKILEHFDAGNANELIDKMLYCDLQTRLPDHLMMIEDRMTMAHSLESRSPLVDPRLVEFAARIPSNMKVRGVQLKAILRRTASRYLPRDLIYRKKQGFGFPIADWMRTDLNRFMRNLFAESRFVELGIFRQESIQRYLDEHLSGNFDHNFRLWILLNLEIWYRLYFEDMSLDEMHDLTDRLMRQ